VLVLKGGYVMSKPDVDIQAMWKEYSLNPGPETKNKLVLHYLYLVKSIVYRLMPTYRGYSDYNDLISCGVVGLMDAIGKFDTNRKVKFESYAALRIRGEIIDYIRKQDWAPYSMRKKVKAVTGAYDELEMELGRTPSDTEVADHLDMDEKEVQDVVNISYTFNLVYFEEMINQNQTLGDIVLDGEQTLEEDFEDRETERLLGDYIDSLPEKERLVITLYYYEELKLKDIAQLLNMSESRISQIHSKAIAKLRTKMQNLVNG
jgi:RNA polymerase sigma factor for flagellar operon FliA